MDENNRIIGFQEKPQNPAPMPSDPTKALVSMGNYFFKARVLEEALIEDAFEEDSKHDFGIPENDYTKD